MPQDKYFKKNVSLRELATFGIGGRAAYYRRISEPAELIQTVKLARRLGISYRLISGGSNVVFSDSFFAGLLIHFINPRAKIVVRNRIVEAPASLPLMSLIKSSIEHGLGGLEALSGIPGTLGGALVGNAGAYGQCISDNLVAVQIFDPNIRRQTSNIRWISPADCRFAYRESVFKKNPPGGGWLILAARFKLRRGDKKLLARKSREIVWTRAKKYRPGLKCPGSFFKNVLVKDVSRKAFSKIDRNKIIDGKIPAGWLLEQVGACGLELGRLQVAGFHGNLIVNRGGATFGDVQKLARILKRRVVRKFGIKLEEEIRYLI